MSGRLRRYEGARVTDGRAAQAAAQWQPLRWPVDMTATVQEHRGCAFTIQVVDIAATGCRIWAGFQLTPGRAAKIAMGGFAPFSARVSWSRDWYAELEFDRPLHHSVLRHLVDRHPARADRGVGTGAGPDPTGG